MSAVRLGGEARCDSTAADALGLLPVAAVGRFCLANPTIPCPGLLTGLEGGHAELAQQLAHAAGGLPVRLPGVVHQLRRQTDKWGTINKAARWGTPPKYLWGAPA